ncbi:MAG: sarcosine oxidase subunit gamma [Gammaproteobacteria bacterium]|nr:sarcosine oxidase subunit gamma [Gammaproteobacteria bacterium]MDH3536795.1 sarcosine oxidase subunit gamma [Gammaproteobacteria bacterium]
MSDMFQQESPLVQIKLGEPRGNAPRIEEKPFLGYINLRGKPGNTRFVAGVLKVLGVEAPTAANTVIEAGDNRIYWLGPDEWLVVTPAGQQDKLKADLLAALKGAFCSVVDNSSGLTMVRISGANAGALLATDCPLDLHPREFRPGQCAQTRLAKAGMIVAPLDDGSGFDIIIRRSFADYLLQWLQDAALAFA